MAPISLKARPRPRARTLWINDRPLTVEGRETVLETALRHGVPFPNSCRVGGCGTCKCRLTGGDVRELTETGYLLSREEIDSGYILACQSVPGTDARIELPVADRPPGQRVSGRVVGQEKVTPDITHLTIQLDEAISYRAGQLARFTADALPGVTRSYSFACPPRGDGRVELYIRKVPGGRFSTLVSDQSLLGARLRVEGPEGDLWLRPGGAPILMVAGGSGLGPILAMLEDAAGTDMAARSVTLLLGVRGREDLYALDRIDALARRWTGPFRFIPVLSEAADDPVWEGRRGLVTEVIPTVWEEGGEAYLCGPAGMVDAALEVLRRRRVPPDRIHFDRFTTLADVTPAAGAGLPPRATVGANPSAAVSFLHYLKFFGSQAVGLVSAASIVAGGWLTTLGLGFLAAVYLLGDAFGGDDTSTPSYRHPAVLTVQLWLALPLLALIVFVSVWSVCAGDPLGFGAAIVRMTGYDALAARAATGFGHHVSAGLLTGFMIGLCGTIPAHELTHRTWDRGSTMIGRWLLAFSFDTAFAIEHVYGHHRYVATREDPATAPRGRNVYSHIVVSTIKGNVSAWKIEALRLAKRRLSTFSLRNACLRGQLMSAALLVAAYAMGGPGPLLYFVACALWGKALLEIVNYMEHYGMVRDPAKPVEPRHSWNTNRRVSSWTMFNLTRHSHHHAQGEVPYQNLRPYPDAPMMIGGYLSTILVAMVPPWWHRLMTRKVMAWDRDYATDAERALVVDANATSGIRALQEQATRAA